MQFMGYFWTNTLLSEMEINERVRSLLIKQETKKVYIEFQKSSS